MSVKKRRTEPSLQERREYSEVCRSWIKNHGRVFRDVVNCGKALTRFEGAMKKDALGYGYTVEWCARTLEQAAKPEHHDALDVIARCVSRGYSHGVLQHRRRG